MFHDLALAHGAKRVEVCEVFQEEDLMFREEVLNIMKMNSAFGALYHEPYEEADEKEKKKKHKKGAVDEAEPPVNKFKRAKNSFDDEKYVSPVYEKKGEFRDLPDKYKLGYPVSGHKQKLIFKGGDEETHLGNEGFNSSISSNVAVIAHFT